MDQPSRCDWQSALAGRSGNNIADELFLLGNRLAPLANWWSVHRSFGPDKDLQPQLHALQQAFLELEATRRWELLESIQSRHPLISEAVTTAIIGTNPDIHFVSECFNELLCQPLRLHDECRDIVVNKYELWVSMKWIPTDRPIHTNFYSRIVFGGSGQHMYEESEQLFNVAPLSYLVYNWTLLRNACSYACENNYYRRLVRDMDNLGDDMYLLSAMVQGIGESGFRVPAQHTRFWNTQLYLQHDNFMLLPLNNHRHASEFITINRTEIVSSNRWATAFPIFLSPTVIQKHTPCGSDTPPTPNAQNAPPDTPPTSPIGHEDEAAD
ncbi:uncharacterized protein BDV17DRAFT_270984 [Aspergillus undulatus]|uniref:uncharacterized protein n=1 Tax=Aspergillus undulatus TaxID=1810928 RepID=UPI003CCD111B